MNRWDPLRMITVRHVAPDKTDLERFLEASRSSFDRVLVLPPGATFTTIVPEPGGLRTFRARTSLGLVPVPIGCAP